MVSSAYNLYFGLFKYGIRELPSDPINCCVGTALLWLGVVNKTNSFGTLQSLLGTHIVQNFGVSGNLLKKGGDKPIGNEAYSMIGI